MRQGLDIIDKDGYIVTGFDYRHQVWVKDYIVQPCGHPAVLRLHGPCCNANRYAGLDVRTLYKTKEVNI